MGPRLELRTEQKLIMTPMLQQALRVLQLPTLELSNLVQEELNENPMLEEREDWENESSAVEPEGGAEERTAEVTADTEGTSPLDIGREEWERYFSDDEYAIPHHEREVAAEFFEPQIAKHLSLQEQLLWQLRLIATEDDYRIGEYIIGNLDDRGFFTLGLEDVARDIGATEEQVADVLAMVQELEPPGVAARNVTESLLIQLRHLPERNPLAEAIVERHFTALERHQLEAITRAEKAPRAQVAAAAQVIAGLDPYPGRHQDTGRVEYVIPDVVIEKHDDEYIIIVNDDALPGLKISGAYRRLLRRGSDISAQTRKFLEERLQRAVWLIRSIEQRRKTLYRVVETIVEIQRDFFERGVEHLKPLTLREIADRLHLHESTISRVTSKKYAQTPRGLFELKYFFSSQIRTMDGVGISSTSVKAALQEVVAQENPHRPLSDQRLVALLAEKGFQIARRTVAKYREELNLPPASRRRRLE